METKGYIEIEGVMYRLVSRQKSNHRQIRVRSKGQIGRASWREQVEGHEISG